LRTGESFLVDLVALKSWLCFFGWTNLGWSLLGSGWGGIASLSFAFTDEVDVEESETYELDCIFAGGLYLKRVGIDGWDLIFVLFTFLFWYALFIDERVVIGFFKKEINWDWLEAFFSTASISCSSVGVSRSVDVLVEGDDADGENDFVLNCLLDEEHDVELEVDDDEDDDEADERDDDSLVLNCIFNSANFFNWGFELDDVIFLFGIWFDFCKDGSLFFVFFYF